MKTAVANPTGGSAELARLHQRIAVVRLRHQTVALTRGAVLVAAALIGWLTAEMALDWLIELPWIVRAIMLPAALGGLGYLVWQHVVFPLRNRPNDEAVALMVERAMPIFRSRFIASIQLARAEKTGTVPLLVRALLAETAAMAAQLNFHWVVKTDRLRRVLKISAWVVAVSAALLVLGGRADVPLLKRAFLSTTPVPRKTRILNSTGDRNVGVGDDLNIEATAGGIVPSAGRVTVKYANGQTHQFTLEADPRNRAHFSRVIQSVQEPFTYVIRLGDATSPSFRVTTTPRPAVVSIECEQVYPAYTRLGTAPRGLGDLTLLAGSRLKVKITTNRNITKGVLRSVGVEKETPLRINEKNRRELTGTLDVPAKDLTGFSIDMVDENGVAGKGDAVYRIDLVPDRPPTIRITEPERREELITQQGSLTVGFEAADDFGISKVELHYKTGQDENSPVSTVSFDLGGQADKNVSRRFEWKIKTLNPHPVEGAVIEYWLEATDTNTVTGPGVTATDHYQVKVVSEGEMRAYLASRVAETMEGVKTVEQGQGDASQQLKPLIFEKPPQPPQK